jgi:hypothetical protein
MCRPGRVLLTWHVALAALVAEHPVSSRHALAHAACRGQVGSTVLLLVRVLHPLLLLLGRLVVLLLAMPQHTAPHGLLLLGRLHGRAWVRASHPIRIQGGGVKQNVCEGGKEGERRGKGGETGGNRGKR